MLQRSAGCSDGKCIGLRILLTRWQTSDGEAQRPRITSGHGANAKLYVAAALGATVFVLAPEIANVKSNGVVAADKVNA
jgi:hypothetical protein